MAQYLLVSILVHTPPSGSTLSANDVIDVYWDDSTSAIVVNENGSTMTPGAGDQVGDLNTNYYVSGITSYSGEYAVAGYSFCATTTLNWFKMPTSFPSYPFMVQQQTADSPVCDVGGGVVCDIIFNAPVHAINTTSLSDPDGQIIASAISGNGTVKYGLSDFDYATEGQLSGTFTGLGTGRYTVYAKDENDCTAQTSVFVFFSPAELEHYRFTWASVQISEGTSRDARLRIYEREYIGSVVEVDFGETSPFDLNKPKQGDLNDKFFPIHPTNATLSLMSIKDYQFLPLFTQDNKKYRCVYEVDEGAGFTAIWQGFVIPSTYREDFISPPYVVEIAIGDNVKTLEKELFTDDNGNLLFGELKLIKVIAHIMKKTGLTLSIRSGINIFEANHDTAATDDPLDQTYVDVACYRDGADAFNCWDVLFHILRPFGARIFQYDNQWIIEEIDRAVEEYAYRVFDSDGDYVSNSTFDPVIDVKSPDLTDRAALVSGDHSMEVIPAYGKIDITSKLNYIGSIVAGGFEKSDLLSPESETFIQNQGIYKSEEGFRDWTLRMPSGVSGVSFGRAIVGRRGDSSRTGLKGEDDLTRSVGAFFYNAEAWGGNLRDSYIESAEKDYEYGPNDELNLKFEYSTPAKPEYEFMILRFMLKIGSNYLQPNGTWDTAEATFRAYPDISNSLQEFEISVPVPTTTVLVETTIQVRIYFYASEFYDYGLPPDSTDPADGSEGVADLKDFPTVGINYDYRLDLRQHIDLGDSVTAYFRGFFELRYSTAAESIPTIIHPDDFNSTTNKRIWSAVGGFVQENNPPGNRRALDRKFYLDNIALDALINGQPPPEEDKLSLQISKYINENLEIDLYNFDLPDIVNGKNMYNNYFRLSDGTPTALWTRSGIAESLTLQQILLRVLGSNHSAPTFRITGSFINEFSRIGINNYLRITKPGSSLSVSNTEFTSNLNDWTGDASGQGFTWTADNSGSAEVDLSGAEDSEKRYQEITHSGGYIEFSVQLKVLPSAGNDREDVLWVLFYNGSSIVHMEKMQTFSQIGSDTDYEFTYIAFAPGQITRIGFFFKRVNGTGDCTYQITKFSPAGKDILEVYQISDYQSEERLNTYTFECMQISKTYISLAGVDSGGNNQGGSTTGRAHTIGYSSGYN